MVRVLVADDHPVYRDGVVQAIEGCAGLEVVAEAGDGLRALALIREHVPDVALLDMRMPGLEGPEILAVVVREQLPVRVAFLSAFEERDVVFEVIAAGASAFLPKEADGREICAAVEAVAGGETVIAPGLRGDFFAELRTRERRDRPLLTERERQILALTADGLSGPRIGEELYLSPNTVKTHVARIYDKLGVSDRAAMVAEAMRRGLLQ